MKQKYVIEYKTKLLRVKLKSLIVGKDCFVGKHINVGKHIMNYSLAISRVAIFLSHHSVLIPHKLVSFYCDTYLRGLLRSRYHICASAATTQ